MLNKKNDKGQAKVRLADDPDKRIINKDKINNSLPKNNILEKNFLVNISKKTKSLFYLSILAFFLFLIVFVWLLVRGRNQTNTIRVSELNQASIGFTLTGSEGESIFPIDSNNLIRLSTGQVSILDINGQEKTTISIDCDNPMVVKNKHYILIFDLNGKSYYLFDTKGLIYQGSTNEGIGFANISDEGHVALVLNQSNTRGILRVIDPEGIHLFDYEVRERRDSGYILSAKFSADGQYIDVSMLNTDGVEPFPIIYRFDLLASKVANIYICDTNEALSLIPYSSSTELIIAGNRNIYRLNGEKVSQWINFADIKEVLANDRGICVLASDSVKGEARLVFQEFNQDIGNINNEELKGVAVGATPKLMDISDNYALVADNTVCYKINLKDLSVRSNDLGSEIISLTLDSKDMVTAVTKDRVQVF